MGSDDAYRGPHHSSKGTVKVSVFKRTMGKPSSVKKGGLSYEGGAGTRAVKDGFSHSGYSKY